MTHDSIGVYCITAPGIDSSVTPAAVTVDSPDTLSPPGNASAMTFENFGCGAGGKSFRLRTQRQPIIDSDPGPGVIEASGPAEAADNVAFTIVIP